MAVVVSAHRAVPGEHMPRGMTKREVLLRRRLFPLQLYEVSPADRRPDDLEKPIERAVFPADAEFLQDDGKGQLGPLSADRVRIDDSVFFALLNQPENLSTGRRRG